jgi:hypothetical protein
MQGLMLRASIATGFLPPTIDQIGSSTQYYTLNAALAAQSNIPDINLFAPTSVRAPPDPARGGTKVGSENIFSVSSNGSTHLKPELARSIAVGIVMAPAAFERLHIAVDYTRIDKRREIVAFHNGDYPFFLANEALYPGRVARAPLTDADRAKGYTAGVVTAVDTSSFNIGKTIIDAVDVQADYRIPTEKFGDFSLHAAGTWQPRLARKMNDDSPAVNSAGYADGPLKWRANGGINWQRGALGLGLIATYYAGYRAADSSDSAAVAAQTVLWQGGTRIPGQLYIDFAASRHLAFPRGFAGLNALDIRLGVENLFDHRPPIIVNPNSTNYSLYGDPRLRRAELSMVGHF